MLHLDKNHCGSWHMSLTNKSSLEQMLMLTQPAEMLANVVICWNNLTRQISMFTFSDDLFIPLSLFLNSADEHLQQVGAAF